jgi:hypothetical protein
MKRKKLKINLGQREQDGIVKALFFLINQFALLILLRLALRIFFLLGVAVVADTRLVLGAVGVVQQSRVDGDTAGISDVDKAGGGVDAFTNKAIEAERAVKVDHVKDLCDICVMK